MYINNLDNSEIKSHSQLKADNPTVSIPKYGTEIILGDWYLIHADVTPTYIERLEALPPAFKDPLYTQGWDIVPLTTDQIDTNITEAKVFRIDTVWTHSEQLNLDSAEGIISGKGDIANRASKENSRISNIKLSSGALSSEEEQFFIAYSAMLEYQADVDIVAINTETEINNMNDATAIYAYDVATTPAWPAII